MDEEDDFSADVDVGAALQYWTALRHMGGKGKQKEDSEEDKSEFGMRCVYASYVHKRRADDKGQRANRLGVSGQS